MVINIKLWRGKAQVFREENYTRTTVSTIHPKSIDLW